MHSRFGLVCCGAALAVTLLGCGKKTAEIDPGAFQTAPPELKQGWDNAMAAMQTNGYAVAIMQLQELRTKPGITIEQGKAIDNASTRINEQMYEAANRDDPAGKAAIEELRNAMAR